jgi:hypothetical protein
MIKKLAAAMIFASAITSMPALAQEPAKPPMMHHRHHVVHHHYHHHVVHHHHHHKMSAPEQKG